MSPLAAMTEAEEGEKAKAELSDLLDQIDQTKAEADEAQALIDRLGDRARKAANCYGAQHDLDEAQRALKRAYVWVEASLMWLGKPEPDRPTREDTPVGAALIALHRAAQRLRRPGVNVPRIEMKLVELAEIFDIANEIVRKA